MRTQRHGLLRFTMTGLLQALLRFFLVYQLIAVCTSRTVIQDSSQYNATNIDAEKGFPVDVPVPEEEDEFIEGFVVSNISVAVEQGNLRGVLMTSVQDNSSFIGFLGVPYARPPTGELRFKAPLPADPWTEELIANRSDIKCVQANPITMEMEGSEDCLVLNVYTAKLGSTPSESLLPVMVWIHGGGFEMGSGNLDIFGPDYFVVQGVILVTINYRLGALGFLNLVDDGVSTNAGLKDQVAALRWIKKNIAGFGGDADQVTIFGESAGAACVHYHMMSPMSKGLFHRAISQSGSALNPWAYSKSAQSRALLLGNTLGCDVTNVTRTVQCLMSLESYDIAANAHNHTLTKEDERHYIVLPFVPTSEEGRVGSDEQFLPGDPLELMSAGKFHHDVPYITGVNSIEAALFLPKFNTKDMIAGFNGDFDRMLPADVQVSSQQQGRQLSKRIRTFYFGREAISERTLSNLINMLSDLMFNIGTHNTVQIHSKFSTKPIFMYLFSFDGSLGFAKRLISQTKIPGAVHSDDLGYMFKASFWDLNLPPESPEIKTLYRMVKMWTNFAKTGNPSSELDSVLDRKWAPVSTAPPSYLSINNELRMRVGLDRMVFWERIYSDAAQGVNEVDADEEPKQHATSGTTTRHHWQQLLPLSVMLCILLHSF